MTTTPPEVNIPQVRLPKGGGAIKGIGETFQPSSFTGTGSFTIPIATPTARGLEPNLQLNYSSGGSQGVFGLGFSLSVPNITRRTEKRLPNYSEVDEFVLSDAEYMVPMAQQRDVETDPNAEWAIAESDRVEVEAGIRVNYQVRRYRTRTEGQFLLIERWSRTDGDVHWRVTTPDQITSIYGKSTTARIVHPDHPLQVFSWLLERTEDDRGNQIQYSYKREDQVGVADLLSERDRLQSTQVYLHKIQYGNRQPGDGPNQTWAFSVVFDYGEYDLSRLRQLTTAPTQPWHKRLDSFSDYRAGFEVRTHRLCRHILIFHHFPQELGTQDCLVRAVHLKYQESPVLSFLTEVQQVGYRRQANGDYEIQALPPLTFKYSDFDAAQHSFQLLTQEKATPLPYRFDEDGYQFLDLYGEGISGILYDHQGVTLYWRSQGNGIYAAPQAPLAFPVEHNQTKPSYTLSDGLYTRAEVKTPGRTGFYERVDEDTWTGFQPYARSPIDYTHPAAEYTDVTGDGTADLLLFDEERVKVYPSIGRNGHDAAIVALRSPDLPITEGPATTEKLMFADMGGDGLSDRVRIRNGEVVYWPNLGYGRFGTKVIMEGAPHFGDGMDASRIFLVDIDGSGTSDLVYVESQRIRVYFNQSGNSFSQPVEIGLPAPYHSLSQIQFADIQGNGTACLVFSYGTSELHHQFYDFTAGLKPHLLTEIDNHMGAITRIHYAPSTQFYLADKKVNRPWLTKLPFPVQLVERIETLDLIARSRRVSRFAYHHGAFEFREREFSGFGMVERWDTESFEQFLHAASTEPSIEAVEADLHVPPIYTKTWYHTGTAEQAARSQQFATDYYGQFATLENSVFETPLADPASVREAYRALRGRVLREEVYGLDGEAEQIHPYQVQEYSYSLRLMQPAIGASVPASVYLALPRESLTYQCDRQPTAPRITHRCYFQHDAYGKLTHSAELAYARTGAADHPDQAKTQGKYTVERYIHLTDAGYKLGIPAETQVFELAGLANTHYTWEQFNRIYPHPEQTAVDFDQTPSGKGARLIAWQRFLYWNDVQTEALPLGQAGHRALLHHAETAAYPQAGIETLIQPTGAKGMAAKLLSLDADGGAWIIVRRAVTQRLYYVDPGVTAIYGQGDRFYQAEQYIDQFGTVTAIGYDSYRLQMVRTEAKLSEQQSLIHSVQPDYITLQPRSLRDMNANLTEYLYDPLGNLRVMSHYGQEGTTQRGDRPLAEYQVVSGLNRDRILANPQAALQKATRYFFYDVMAWEQQRQPVYALTLQREIYTSDLGDLRESPLQVTLEYFDGLGRSVQKKQRAEQGIALALNSNDTVAEVQTAERWMTTGWTVYNNKGLVVKQFEPFYSNTPVYQAHPALTRRGVTTVRHYDALGRIRRLDLPTRCLTRTEYSAWDVRDYDANDTLPDSPFYQAQTPAEQLKLNAQLGTYFDTFTRQVLDVWGRTALQQDLLEANSSPLTTYTRLDIAGNPVQLQDPRLFGSDRVNAQMTYDMEGRLLRLIGADNGTHWRLYNAGGDEIQRWDQRGFRVATDYDALSRPIAVWVEKDGVRRQAERIEYGETTDPTGANNLRGHIFNRYDQGGVIQFSRYTIDGEWSESHRRFRNGYRTEPDWAKSEPLDTKTFVTQRFFDVLGRVALLQLPDNRRVRQLYHASGRVRSLQYREGEQYQPFITDIHYNARNQREQVEYANGITTTYQYDPKTFYLTQLLSQRSKDQQKLQNISYSYDPVGNLTEIFDRSHRTVFGGNDVVEPRRTYRYDALYRLITASGREHPGLYREPRHNGLMDDSQFLPLPPNLNNTQAIQNYSRSYTYDTAGNLTQIQHRANRSSFTRTLSISPTSNRGILFQEAAPKTNPESAYDANGNLIQIDHLRSLRWNYRNQLIAVDVIQRTNATNDSEYYIYDALGQRVRKVYERLVGREVEIEETLYFGDYEVHRTRRDDKVMQERTSTHLRLGEEKLATIYHWTVRRQNDPQRQVCYQLGNHQGSVALELDESSNIITYEEYYPYGGTALIASQSDREVKRKVYRYCGRERDAVTQFYDYGSRYYVPWLGRWLSSDPAGFVDGLNLYQFSHNNPIGFVDDGGTTSRRVNPASMTSSDFSSSDTESGGGTGVSMIAVQGSQHLEIGRRVRRRPRLPDEWIQTASSPTTGGQGNSSLAKDVASGGGASPAQAVQPDESSGRSRASSFSSVADSIRAQRGSIAMTASTDLSADSSSSKSKKKSEEQVNVPLSTGIKLDMDMETATLFAVGILVGLELLNQQAGQAAAEQPANRSDSEDSTRSQSRSPSVSSLETDTSSSGSDADSEAEVSVSDRNPDPNGSSVSAANPTVPDEDQRDELSPSRDRSDTSSTVSTTDDTSTSDTLSTSAIADDQAPVVTATQIEAQTRQRSFSAPV